MNNYSLIKNQDFGKHYLFVLKFFIKESIKNNSNSVNYIENDYESKNQFCKIN